MKILKEVKVVKKWEEIDKEGYGIWEKKRTYLKKIYVDSETGQESEELELIK